MSNTAHNMEKKRITIEWDDNDVNVSFPEENITYLEVYGVLEYLKHYILHNKNMLKGTR